MNVTLEEALKDIDKKQKPIINLGNQLAAITPKLEPFDLLLISVVNRVVNINSGFCHLMRNRNFFAAAPMVRINLDSLLRIFASYQTDLDRNSFALAVMGGEEIRKMKFAGTTERLQDVNLVRKLSEVDGMQWVKQIYDAGNSYVHFGDAIFFGSRIIDEEKRMMYQSIGLHDSFVPDDQKVGAAIWMNLIIDSIILQCQIWMWEKCERYNFNFEDLENIR
jgi:hypothetical protein